VIALPAMAGFHAIIGVGEAIITTTAVSLILKTRPDLVSCFHKRIVPSGLAQEGGIS
jgi:Cobalt uptake substrate-specific transmembrane region